MATYAAFADPAARNALAQAEASAEYAQALAHGSSLSGACGNPCANLIRRVTTVESAGSSRPSRVLHRFSTGYAQVIHRRKDSVAGI